MRYIIREKFFRLTEDAVIQDEQGAPIYQVKGKIFSRMFTTRQGTRRRWFERLRLIDLKCRAGTGRSGCGRPKVWQANSR